MVLSQINTQTSYREKRAVDPEDVGYSAAIYEMEAFGAPIIVTLGKPKFTFSAKHIVFYPIYAVRKNGRIEAQIGVFEIEQDRAIKVLDEDGDLDIDKLGAPLFYAFSEKLLKESAYSVDEYLNEWSKPAVKSGGDSTEKKGSSDSVTRQTFGEDELDPLSVGVPSEKASPETESMRATLSSGVFEPVPEPAGLPMLIEETDIAANAVKKEYRVSSSHCWLQTYMKNDQYAIHDVEPGGDSLFAVVRDAFLQGSRRTTVAKLRALVATEINDSEFHQRRREFLDLDGSAKRGAADLKRIKDVSSPGLKKRATAAQKSKSQDELSRIVSEGTTLKTHFQALTTSVKDVEHQIKVIGLSEMGKVDSLDTFRALIQTSSYPADAFSIETLERKLSVKIVVLSENAYIHGDLTCVVECGAYKEGDAPAPKHYILAVRKGGHYRLVSYKTKKLLAFSELPYHIKVLIVNKCLEENAGDFWEIQDFRNLKTRLAINADAGRRFAADAADESRGLYDTDSMLMFHAKSCKIPLPGMGQGESRLPRHALEFSELGGKVCEGWRRVLDDDWIGAPFVVDGRKYASVEHYFQSSKFRAGFPDFALRFSTAPESDDAKEGIKLDVAAAKALGSEAPPKRGAKSARPENIVVDPEFYPTESKNARLAALRAKFGQNQDAKNILLLTRDAELTRYYVNRPAERDAALMTVRRELLK